MLTNAVDINTKAQINAAKPLDHLSSDPNAEATPVQTVLTSLEFADDHDGFRPRKDVPYKLEKFKIDGFDIVSNIPPLS